MAQARTNILSGCCGFATAQAKYFAAYRCVEIDSSFYQLPRLETAAKWRANAPAGFQFSMKAWQVITHCPTSPTYKRTRLDDHDREHCGHFGYNATIRWAWDQTLAVAKELDAHLVLFQCPASFRSNKENVTRFRQFFERAKRGKFICGWEPRGEWEPDLIASLCRELDLLHVTDPFVAMPAHNAAIRYYRLHGNGNSRYHYTIEDFDRLKDACRGTRTSFCLFNNLAMVADAKRFAARL